MKLTRMQRLFRAAAWFLAVVIVLLSVVSPSYRPTIVPSHTLFHVLEHLLAFLAIGLAFGIGYPGRFWILASTLVAFTGAIELAQLWVPGRHARMIDFLLDVTALYVGIGLSFVRLEFRNVFFRKSDS